MRATNGAPDLLTKDEVAAIFRVSRRTVSRWIADGHLKTVRVGSTVRFRRSDVERMLEDEGSAA